MKNLFADVASYQRDDLGYFQLLKSKGYKGVVVKVTEGDAQGSAYVNPKWINQALNALAAGMQVSVYHFARYSSPENARAEADFFLKQVLPFGFDQSTVCAVDCETNDYHLDGRTYEACTNAWLNEVRKHFKKTSVQASKSWFTSFINSHAFGDAIIWLAGYGIDSLGIDNAGAWQWDNGESTGLGCDSSYDFEGSFTTSETPSVQAPPQEEKIIKIQKGEKITIEGV